MSRSIWGQGIVQVPVVLKPAPVFIIIIVVTADPIRTLPVSSLPRSVGRGPKDVIALVTIRKCKCVCG